MNLFKLAITATLLTFASSAISAEWMTRYKNDEMRGTARKFLQIDSDNSVEFDFPYNGGAKLSIILRSKNTELKEGQKPEDLKPTEALLVISKGQFICNSYNDCKISAKFDNGKIMQYSMTESGDGSSDVIFFDNSSTFIKNLQSHKKLIIEAGFFQAGTRQFKFDLEGYPSGK